MIHPSFIVSRLPGAFRSSINPAGQLSPGWLGSDMMSYAVGNPVPLAAQTLEYQSNPGNQAPATSQAVTVTDSSGQSTTVNQPNPSNPITDLTNPGQNPKAPLLLSGIGYVSGGTSTAMTSSMPSKTTVLVGGIVAVGILGTLIYLATRK